MSKVLICYFSAGGEDLSNGTNEVGNTECFAQEIEAGLKADNHDVTMFKIQPTVPYPTGYDQKLVKAMEERAMQERPDYVGDVEDFDSYDTVFIGFPIWSSDLPMIVYNFLEKHVFTGKIVIPFCTHGGSGAADTFRIVGEKAVGSAPEQGLSIEGRMATLPGGKKQIAYWLEQLAI